MKMDYKTAFVQFR